MPYNLSTLTLITTPERKDYTASMSQEARQSIRQRLQAERGTIVKAAGQARIRFALAYPNTYFRGMSNLGLQTMYRVLNQRPDTLCERVFFTAEDSAAGAAVFLRIATFVG